MTGGTSPTGCLSLEGAGSQRAQIAMTAGVHDTTEGTRASSYQSQAGHKVWRQGFSRLQFFTSFSVSSYYSWLLNWTLTFPKLRHLIHIRGSNINLLDTSKYWQQYQSLVRHKTQPAICFYGLWKQQEVFKLKATSVSSFVFLDSRTVPDT